MDYRKRSKSNPLDFNQDHDIIHYDIIFNEIPAKKSRIDCIIQMLKWVYKKLMCSKTQEYLNV